MNGSSDRFLIIKAPWVLGRDGQWMENASILWDSSSGVVVDVFASRCMSCRASARHPHENGREILHFVRDDKREGLGMTASPCHSEASLSSTVMPSVSEASPRILDLDGMAVIPGLVNAHTHLELSALSGLFQEISPGDYLGWVRNLMFKRNTLSEGEIYKAFADAAKKCADEGTAIVGDVSNIPLVKYFNAENRENLPWRYLFWEWIGFTVMSIRQLSPKASRASARHPQEEGRGSLTSFGMTGLSNGKTWVDQFSIVSHAVYSTSAYLIKKTKDWCKKRGRIFSIHVGETEEERKLIEEGKGAWKEFLEELGKWDNEWKPPGTTPVRYLENLGALDENTLLVHCLHLRPDDWDAIRKNQCAACLCPRSNHKLGVGAIPASEILKRRISFLIGTDSLASSPSLNIFEEAVFLLEHYPIFDPHSVLKAVTGEGYRFFMKTETPFVEAGFRGKMLAVSISPGVGIKELSEDVLYNGLKGAFSWIPTALK